MFGGTCSVFILCSQTGNVLEETPSSDKHTGQPEEAVYRVGLLYVLCHLRSRKFTAGQPGIQGGDFILESRVIGPREKHWSSEIFNQVTKKRPAVWDKNYPFIFISTQVTGPDKLYLIFPIHYYPAKMSSEIRSPAYRFTRMHCQPLQILVHGWAGQRSRHLSYTCPCQVDWGSQWYGEL
jgi:hypothetical protein